MKPILVPFLAVPALIAPLAVPIAHAVTEDSPRAESYHTSWARVHDDTVKASQFPRAVAMDARGNVFVTGHMDVSSSKQLYVAKYDGLDGRRLWQRTITASGNNQVLANAIAVDAFGDCIVVGSRNLGGAVDFYTHKFAGGNGGDVWAGGARTLNGTADGGDIALKVITDNVGDVIVTGRSAGTASGDDIVTVKYARATGNQVGVIDRYSAVAGTFNDYPGAIATDGTNIFVGGVAAFSNGIQRFVVRKLHGDLSVDWTITPIDLGGEGGVTGLAVDNAGSVVATGLAKNANLQFGYYTTSLSGLDGSLIWKTNVPSPVSADTFGVPRPGPVGVVIGPDNQPIVSGTLIDANGTRYIHTAKYTSGGFFEGAALYWEKAAIDYGFGFGDTIAAAVSADRDSNAIVVGASKNEDGDEDIYIAKYDALTGERTYFQGFAAPAGVDDRAVATAVDRLGNIVVLGDVGDSKGGSPGVTYREFATIKLQRFIALSGDRFRLDPDSPDYATYLTGNPPAVADNGAVAAKVTVAVGKKKLGAILTQGGAGASNFAALQGSPAPGASPGTTVGNWSKFSDPVIAPNGTYAFAAKVTGSSSKANGLWSNASGDLRLVLQQGTPVPGLNPAANLGTIMSYTITNNDLLVLMKVAGPAPGNTVLLRLSANNTPTVLLRGGQTAVMLDNTPHTVKSFTVLSPAPASPGDGRWDSFSFLVARVVATETANPKISRQALVRIATSTGAVTALSYTGRDATEVAMGATYKSFGLPAVANLGIPFAYSAVVNPLPDTITGANDAALIYTQTGSPSSVFAREGDPVPTLPATVKYSGFSDPIIASNFIINTLFQATFKSGGGVTSANNRALMFGSPTGMNTVSPLARTGDDAAQPLTDDLQLTEDVTKYSAFTTFALPDNPGASSPVFVAKLSGAPGSSNVGLFARGSDGALRRLLRTGDDLGGRTVKSISLLNAVSKVFGAGRSFNNTGSVVVALTFTDRKTALMHVAIP